MKPIINLHDLEFSYGDDFRLRVVNLSIERCCATAILGPSGSGKTTLLHLIAGIMLPQTGCLTVDDADLTAMSDSARRAFRIRNIGLVFQEFELLEYLNVLDNILLPYRMSPALTLDADASGRAMELAASVGLRDKLRRNVRCLSQGERQRAAVCRALIAEPGLVLADEPTGNLDPANKQRALDILLEYAGRSGATVVMVTHDHDLLPRFDRIIDLDELDGAPAS